MKSKLLIFTVFFVISASMAHSLTVERVVVGLDGYVRAERWIPVVFSLKNSGDHFQGSIEIHLGDTVFRKSLDVGAGAERRTELLYYQSARYETLSYRILDHSDEVAAEDRLEVRILNQKDNLVLVLSSGDYNHQFLNGQENPWGGKTFVAYMKPSEMFSDSLSYSSADSLVIGTLSVSEIAPARWTAFWHTVSAGGTLVSSAATDLSVLQHPDLRNALPRISPELTESTRGEFLSTAWARDTTDPFPSFSCPAQRIQPRPSDLELLTSPSGVTLATSSPYYKGNLIHFAFDYTRLPEEIRTVFSFYWNDLVHPSSSSGPPMFWMPFRKRLEENPRVQKFLYDIPGLRPPDLKVFALFFFIYLCAIGPLQYLILKILKKNYLLWVTFPTTILVFTLGSFGYSKFTQSNERRITNVIVREIFPESNSRQTFQVYGTVLSQAGTYDIHAVPENSFLRKNSFQNFQYVPEPYVLEEDLPRQITGEKIKNWTFKTFDAISVENGPYPITVTAHIVDNELTGVVQNNSPDELTDSFFFYDFLNSVTLGSIPPESSRNFSVPLKGLGAAPFAEQHLRDLLHLYSVSYSDPHLFFGQVSGTQSELFINGKSRKTYSTQYIGVYVNIRDAGPLKRLKKVTGSATASPPVPYVTR